MDLSEISDEQLEMIANMDESRILHISKDDLRMAETILFWSDQLDQEVLNWWTQLNQAWDKFQLNGELPPCSCADQEGGFMAKEAYNPYFYNGVPCSVEWLQLSSRKLHPVETKD